MTQKPGRPESEWSGRMKRIAVLGDTLAGGKIYGIQRFAFELLRQLDRMDLGGMEIELVIPEHAPETEMLSGLLGLEDFEPVKQEIKETKRLKRKLKRKKSSVETV